MTSEGLTTSAIVPAHKGGVTAIAVDKGATRVASGGTGEIVLRDPDDLREMGRTKVPSPAIALGWLADVTAGGKKTPGLASLHRDGKLRFFTRELAPVRELALGRIAADAAAIGAGGLALVEKGRLTVVDLATGKRSAASPFVEAVALAASPEGDGLAAASPDGTVWRRLKGNLTPICTVEGASAVAIDEKGRVVAGGKPPMLSFWKG